MSRKKNQRPTRGRSVVVSPINWRIESIVLCLIVIGAWAIRLYRLGDFPDTVIFDEADTVQNAARILHGQPPEHGILGLDWSQNPALSVYKMAAFLAIFGFNITAMRLPGVLASVLALIPFYFLLRRQVSPLAASLATVLLATELWYLHFSRSGWILIDVVLYLLMTMLLLLTAIDKARVRGASRRTWLALFAGAGLFCSLGLYAYTAGRTITIAVAAFLPVALLLHREHARQLFTGFLVLFAVEVLLLAPQATVAVSTWQHFNLRTGVVFIGNSPDFQADPAGTMLLQFYRNLLGPWIGSVNNTPQYTPVNEPQLSVLGGALALLGMFLSLALERLRRQSETWLWWLVLLVAWATTQLLTVNTPNGARGLVYLPALLYFAALGIDWAEKKSTRLVKDRRGKPRQALIVAAVLATVVLIGAAWNVAHYAAWQSQPGTRQVRHPYITAREFPEWASDIVDRAEIGERATNVGAWRDAHPLADIADPYGQTP